MLLTNDPAQTTLRHWVPASGPTWHQTGEIEVLDAPPGGRTPDELVAEVERHRHEPMADDAWVLGYLNGPDGTAIVVWVP